MTCVLEYTLVLRLLTAILKGVTDIPEKENINSNNVIVKLSGPI